MNTIRKYSGRIARPLGNFEEKVPFNIEKGKKVIESFTIIKSYPKNESNVVIELPVDQFAGMPFMLNKNGFITNDIMMFEECQSDSVARAILNRLKIIHPQSVDQNLTVDQMMASIVPANYGSPSEFVSAHQSVASKLYKLHADEVAVYQAKMQAVRDALIAKESQEIEKSVPNPE